MKDCLITLKINGENVTFTSDKDLDAYLYRHQDLLIDLLNIKDIDATLHASKDQNNPEGLSHVFKNRIQNHVNSKRTHASPSNMWKYLGKASSFDKESDYSKWLSINNIDKSKAGDEKIYRQYELDKEIHTKSGEAVHTYLEQAINPIIADPSTKYVQSSIMKNNKSLKDEFKEALNARFNKKWSGISEVNIISDQLDVNTSKILTDSELNYNNGILISKFWPQSKKNIAKKRIESLTKNPISKIKGKVDLIVFDEHGYIHLFDYKTYSGAFDSNKEKSALYQLVTYSNILEQAGYKVASVNVVPIKLNIDVNKKVTIENFTINKIENYSLSSIKNEVSKYIQLPNKKETVDSLGECNDISGKIYPETDINKIQKRKAADIKNYINRRGFIKNVLEGDSGWNPKNGKAIKYFWDRLERKKIYIYDKDSDEDIHKKVEEYLDRVNQRRDNEISSFADLVHNSIINKSLDYFKNSISKLDESSDVISHLEYSFRKYIVNGWSLNKDEILINNGILLFEKDQRYEVVVLDVLALNTIYDMTYKNTILGNKRIATDIQDSSVTLDSRRAHLLLIKTMMFINNNPDLIKGKIQEFKAVNLHLSESVEAPLTILQDNYKRLCATYMDLNLPNLKSNLFMNDVNAHIFKAYDWLHAFQDGASKESLKLNRIEKKTSESYSRNEILKIVRDFAFQNGITSFQKLGSMGDWKLPAYYELLQAYFSTYDVNLFTEVGLGKWFTGISFNGTEDVPFSASTSGILKQLDSINADYNTAVRTHFEQEIKPWQQKIKLILSKRENSGLSNNNYFSQWFVKTSEGIIDNEFIIKPLSEFIDQDERDAAKYMLDIMAKYRGWDQNTIDNKRNTPGSEYYQIPLIKATMLESLQNKGNPVTAIKDWWSKVSEMDIEKALGLAPLTPTQQKIMNNLDVLQIENMMLNNDPEHRADLLSKGVNNYSHDLDKIFLVTLSHSIRSELSRDYMPVFTGFRVWLDTVNNTNSTNADEISNITKAVSDWIKRNVFGRSLVDPHEMFILKLSELIRQMTSGVTLAFTMTGAARELLVSSMTTFMGSKDWSDPDIKDAKIVAKAYCDTIAQLHETLDILSKDQQLNSLFGMAGIDIYTLGENNRTHKWKLNNATGDWLYVMQQAPDYFHRLSYLKAKLIARGSFDAYQMNEDGILTYDFEKDNYYALYRKYANTPVKEIPVKDFKEFKRQEEHYIEAINDWKKISGYENLKIGDSLPQALSPAEIHGVHVNCNLMHGFYNSDSKTLLQQTLYGGLLFQFKTVPLARMVKLFHPTEAVNVKTSFPVIDPNTNQQVWIDAENRMKLESDITEEDKENGYKPFRVSQNNPLVGNVTSAWNAIEAAYNIGLKGDPKLWNEYINDPWNRRSLYIALWDLLGMAILQFLVSLAHPNATKNIRTAHWLERFSYTVLNGAVTDVGVFNVINSVVGDGAPPSFAIIQRWVDNTMSVIYGDMNPIYATLNTFGATRPLSNIAYAW